MLIDWFTVGAQIINFLILVWLLKRFLYKPILHAIDEREKRIAAELADAAAKQTEAQKERDEFQHKNEEFDQHRAALLSQATDVAKTERQRLLDEARQAADALSAKRQDTLRNEAQSLNQTIRRRTQQEVFAIARKALTDLAATTLEERLGEVFIRRLQEMDGTAKAGLAAALKASANPARVRSAFDLPAKQRAVIQKALNDTFSAEIPVRFETAPDLISGIELTANGHKVAWSISDYLMALEKAVADLLKEKDKAETQAKTPSDLIPQVSKRAYELYEKHGRKDGRAIQDWERAEREVRKEMLDPVKGEHHPEAKPKPEAHATAALKPEAKIEPKPEVKPEAIVKAEPIPKEPKPEATSQ